MNPTKKILTFLAVVGVFASIALASGCAVSSDGKLAASVQNPFPWAKAESQPAK